MTRPLTLLSRLASDVQLMFRRPPRQQYAALCYRVKKRTSELEVLLLTSRDTGRWIIPKGWPMDGRTAYEVAAREAFEEAGVRGTVESDILGTYSYPKVLKNGLSVTCKVQVYTLEVANIAKNFKEKGERKTEWVSCDEAAKRVYEPELREIFLLFKRRMAEQLAARMLKQIPAE
ncbi:ADP-ribose pyrophosphatase YjhB (NUDIX family) [Rhizobium sp. BK068]|nr:ADP-ribose pyrophosphatase YjhB (NUDIX family) [Rhizobium sp. BK068]